MKKSTKLITTAVAMVLVLGVMVVGILAATQASASITAQVSWTATAGVQFSLDGAAFMTKAHYEANGNTLADYDVFGSNYYWTNDDCKNAEKMETITVNTTTSNTDASSESTNMQRSFNVEFVDDTPDDGVNNPRSIIFVYHLKNLSPGTAGDYSGNHTVPLKWTITDAPTSTSDVTVTFASDYGSGCYAPYYGDEHTPPLTWTSEIPTVFNDSSLVYMYPGYCFLIKLTLNNPDVSLDHFDADVSFSIEKA